MQEDYRGLLAGRIKFLEEEMLALFTFRVRRGSFVGWGCHCFESTRFELWREMTGGRYCLDYSLEEQRGENIMSL